MQDFAAGKVPAMGRALNQLTCLLKSRRAARVMKLTGIILLAGCLQLSARGLTQTVTISVKDAPLLTVLKAIEKQTSYVFFVDNQWLQKAKKVTITASNVPLQKVLDECFKDQPLTYSITGKVINITPKEEKATNVDLISTADPGDVKGRVVNENGEPVVATITVKGTNKGANTNENGEFFLAGIDNNATLIITGVGIESRELRLNGNRNLNVIVRISVTPLEETIIKGYYTTSRRFNTGNVSKITSEDIQRAPISNPIAALSGRVPGLYIRQFSGTPGRTISMTLRGQNSLRVDGNDPLVIIDGVPFPSNTLSTFFGTATGVSVSSLGNINPNDIESIEVLKDADATAIYGSRGANGVILITTKKGKSGNTKVDINLTSGAGKITREMNLLNTDQYLEMRQEAFKNDGLTPSPADYDINGTWDTTRYTDWQKILIGGTAKFYNAQVSLSGGNANTQYSVGGGYINETTVFPGDFSDRKISARFNLVSTSTNKKLKMVFSGNYLSNKDILPQQNLVSYIGIAPNAPSIYDANGNLNWENETWFNPFTFLLQKHKSKTENLISSIDISYEMLPGLQLKSTAGYNSLNFNEIILTPKLFYSPSQVNSQQNKTNFVINNIRTWIFEPQINYRKRLWKGELKLLFGSTFQGTYQENLAQTGTGFTSESLMENLAAASNVTVNGANYLEYRYNAIFGRINYNLQDKYVLNLTGRRDGSSRFGPNKEFANFGAAGVSWIFSNEPFIRKIIPQLSFGKIRISYGTTGNDKIADYGFLSTYSSSGLIYQGVSGLAPARLYNRDYSWELNKKLESGVEIGIFNDRILLNISYYNNRSSNQLVGYTLPATTGFNSVQFNLPATVQNSGFEFEANTTNIRTNSFTWTTALNVTIPKNKLVSFPNLVSSSYASQYSVGKSLYALNRYHFTGVDSQTGLYTFEDVDKDGSLSFPNDFQFIKERSQKYFGGIQNTFRFKGLEASFLVQYVKQIGENYLSTFDIPGMFNANQPEFVINRWRKPGDISPIQQFTQDYSTAYDAASNNAYSSDNAFSDASFFRLRNVYIAYIIPAVWRHIIKIQNFKVYLQGENIVTITKFKGLDPESQGTPQLPPLKMLTIGINLSF